MKMRGFTLLELLIVVANISMIAAVAIPSVLRAQRAAPQPAEATPQRRIRVDSRQWDLTVLCDTATGTLIYVTTSGIAVGPGGCK